MAKRSGSKGTPFASTISMTRVLYAAVLAGGRSSRMGEDKRFMQWEGKACVDRAVQLAAETLLGDSAGVLLCGAVPGRPSIADEIPGKGPLGGVLSAVRRVGETEGAWVLVLPVDMPGLSVTVLRDLLANRAKAEEAGQGAVGLLESEVPFVFRSGRHVEKVLRQMLESNDPRECSVRKFCEKLGVLRLTVRGASARSFMNVNTPEEWKTLTGGGS